MDLETKRYIDDLFAKQSHDGNQSQRINFFDIFGKIETVTATPTGAPVGGSPFDQVKIVYTAGGPAWALAVYDYQNNVWKSTALT